MEEGTLIRFVGPFPLRLHHTLKNFLRSKLDSLEKLINFYLLLYAP